jgi:hypothetical protein
MFKGTEFKRIKLGMGLKENLRMGLKEHHKNI